MSERRKMQAMDASPGGWGEVGDARMTRYSEPIKDRRRGRRKCSQRTPDGDCQNKRTHTGFANGVALMSGCEFHVARWVRGDSGSEETPDGR